MSALQLTPKGSTYLRTDIVQQQLSQNEITLALNSANAAAGDDVPKLKLDGTGRAYLTGNIVLSGSTPTAGDELFTLPKSIIPEKDFFLPVLKENAAGTTFSNNGVCILNSSSGLAGVTVTNPGSYASVPTISTTGAGSGAVFQTRMYLLSATLASNPTGGTSFVPNDVINLSYSSSNETMAKLNVVTTGVYNATVAAGGSGGTNGTQTVTGTTGTGTKFTASVTVSGGAITAVNSITTAGVYTVNPTTLTAEPVTGASLTGATLSIQMKPVDLTVNTAGSYLSFLNPTAQTGTASPSGAGGCTFNTVWGILSIVVLSPGSGYDNTSALVISGGGGAGGGAGTLILSEVGTQSGLNIGTLAISATHNDILYLDGTVFFVKSY